MSRTRWIVAAVTWAGVALLALLYRDELAASTVGTIGLVAVFAPVAVALYLLVHVLGEGVVLLLLLGAFKVVTLGLVRVEFTGTDLPFPWYGFKRADDGALMASENAMALIGIAACAVAGAVGCFFFYA